MKYEASVNGNTYTIEINEDGHILLNGEEVEVDFGGLSASGLYSLLVNNESFEALVEQRDDIWQVLMRGTLYDVSVADERALLLHSRSTLLVPDTGEVAIKAPMPGLVIAVLVHAGQEISAGDNLIILESMKMENELKAPRAGRVERISVQPGNNVEQNQTLIVIV
ncbi:MAG: biotin attachment protein [Rubrivivax sp.]|nr:biotin attachment protein [Rubrivivax sp.]